MPLFWITTSAISVSPGASEKFVRPSGAIRDAWMAPRQLPQCRFFFQSEDVDVRHAFAVEPFLRKSTSFFDWSSNL